MIPTVHPLYRFHGAGRASFIVGGQWGSEAKGCAAAWIAAELAKTEHYFDIVTTNAGAQAGHTSIHEGKKRVVYHLPTAPLIARDVLGENPCDTFLNAGSVIDPEAFEKELNDVQWSGPLYIHPHAAVITDECREAERKADSTQTKIASTRKGVGQALARKVVRSGLVAKGHPFLKQFTCNYNLNAAMAEQASVLVEVPQGVSLSINHGPFYPYCTSRDCTPASAMADAGIHPSFYNQTLVVLRTFPIRVGNIVEDGKKIGHSGPCYHDQQETSWNELGVEAEITTVTKRVRRVFTFSEQQIRDTFDLCYPNIVFLTFCNYAKKPGYLDGIVASIERVSKDIGITPVIYFQDGPTTKDIRNVGRRLAA